MSVPSDDELQPGQVRVVEMDYPTSLAAWLAALALRFVAEPETLPVFQAWALSIPAPGFDDQEASLGGLTAGQIRGAGIMLTDALEAAVVKET